MCPLRHLRHERIRLLDRVGGCAQHRVEFIDLQQRVQVAQRARPVQVVDRR